MCFLLFSLHLMTEFESRKLVFRYNCWTFTFFGLLVEKRVVFQLSTSSYLCPTPSHIFMESRFIKVYILTVPSEGLPYLSLGIWPESGNCLWCQRSCKWSSWSAVSQNPESGEEMDEKVAMWQIRCYADKLPIRHFTIRHFPSFYHAPPISAIIRLETWRSHFFISTSSVIHIHKCK